MAPSRWQTWRESFGWWFGLLAVVWLAAAVAVLAVWFLRQDAGIPWFVFLYALVTAAASLFAFVAYGLDKRRAVREQRRIPERVLLAAALLGGWPGAFLGERVFRHKTQKVTFRLWFWLIVLLHAGCLAYAAYAFFTHSPGKAA